MKILILIKRIIVDSNITIQLRYNFQIFTKGKEKIFTIDKGCEIDKSVLTNQLKRMTLGEMWGQMIYKFESEYGYLIHNFKDAVLVFAGDDVMDIMGAFRSGYPNNFEPINVIPDMKHYDTMLDFIMAHFYLEEK